MWWEKVSKLITSSNQKRKGSSSWESWVSLPSSNSISFHCAGLPTPGQASPVGNRQLANVSFPLSHRLLHPPKGPQLVSRVRGTTALGRGTNP